MNKTIITVSSITYALKAKKLLARKNISSNLIKINASSSSGCIYGIEIRKCDFLDTVKILIDNAIEYSLYESKQ